MSAKDKSEFYFRKDTGRLRRECKECVKKRHRELGLNITETDYDMMFAAQKGRCGICGSKYPGNVRVKQFAVDHCHKTGRIRGLLCSKCNLGLGNFKDNPDWLRKAAQWVEDIVSSLGEPKAVKKTG